MSNVVPSSDETIRRVEEGIARMNKLDRKLFISVRFDDLSYEEAAHLHGVSPRRVERAVVNALIVIGAARRGDLPRWWQIWRR